MFPAMLNSVRFRVRRVQRIGLKGRPALWVKIFHTAYRVEPIVPTLTVSSCINLCRIFTGNKLQVMPIFSFFSRGADKDAFGPS